MTLITTPTLIETSTINIYKLGYVCAMGCTYIHQRIEDADLDLITE